MAVFNHYVPSQAGATSHASLSIELQRDLPAVARIRKLGQGSQSLRNISSMNVLCAPEREIVLVLVVVLRLEIVNKRGLQGSAVGLVLWGRGGKEQVARPMQRRIKRIGSAPAISCPRVVGLAHADDLLLRICLQVDTCPPSELLPEPKEARETSPLKVDHGRLFVLLHNMLPIRGSHPIQRTTDTGRSSMKDMGVNHSRILVPSRLEYARMTDRAIYGVCHFPSPRSTLGSYLAHGGLFPPPNGLGGAGRTAGLPIS